jgi:preprotein translocase subunit Sec61beta
MSAGDDPRFAPRDLGDGREKWEWQSRYPRRAWLQISLELIYLFCILALAPITLFLIWRGTAQSWLSISGARSDAFARQGYAWVAGTLGGTLFAMKWLYHGVAKGWWSRDRLPWRLMAPHLSGALSFALLAFLASGLIGFFDEQRLRTPEFIVAVGFLVGYFSDQALGGLAILAKNIFGERTPTTPPDPK